MVSQRRKSRSNKSSINYWWIPLDIRSFDPDAFPPSNSQAKNSAQSETTLHANRVSTARLLSAVAGLWDFVGQPTVLNGQKANIICYDQRKNKSVSGKGETFSYKPNSGDCLSSAAKSTFGDLKEMKRTLLFASCNRTISNSFIRKNLQDGDTHTDSQSDKAENIVAFSDIKNPIRGVDRIDYDLKDLVEVEEYGFCGKNISGIDEKKNPLAEFSSASKENGVGEGCEVSFTGSSKSKENLKEDPNSFCSTYPLQPTTSVKEAIVVLGNPISGLCSNYNSEPLRSTDCLKAQQQQSIESHSTFGELVVEESARKDCDVHKNKKITSYLNVLEEDYFSNNWLCMQQRVHNAFAVNRHAIAGALAGTLVSVCLHPIDTIKTIIQANGASQKSFSDILRHIITEKGVVGLYRGISSNITSSAPISAIYTFTYESVKGALIPVLPKEYHSLAHCIAGGCSSLATSFVFTPSERIKQQMQVGSQYQNCWNALIGCLEKGGITSLYVGWGAVLCRNIPHSVIKFYTYERLKQLFLTAAAPNSTLSSWQTLVCGGLAGSTAALFTTPFDVVKTRLQTQTPGTLCKYDGVLHALQEITKQEGLQGLYRGLAPRLAMYVSQGAIFFASYEFLKAICALDVPKQPSRVIENEQKEDDAVQLRVQKLHS
uniref:Uncharacterized protein n=1 Tax=Ananas comosus var. bracteatus TaxID=296719 RepID=A0A6V7QPM0_ANACO|nr:unnamed protein product [Ananas comosus var. bracteatus]